MQIRCPECETEFRIDRADTPPGGFDTKCWWCSTSIHVGGRPPHSGPEDPEEVAAGTEPGEEPTTDPVDVGRERRSPPIAPVGRSAAVNRRVVPTPSDREELLEMMLNSERERREMAWEMTRELFRIRESVERQQMVVAKLVDTVFNKKVAPALLNQLSLNDQPAEHNHRPGATPVVEPATSTDGAAHRDAPTAQADMEGRLDQLQTALETEKQVIDRLRRGKLEMERRAAEAEATLKALRRRSFMDRLLGRETD